MFDLAPYNFNEDVSSGVQSLIDDDNVTIESLTDLGVSSDTINKFIDDYNKFKSTNKKDGGESDSGDADAGQAVPDGKKSEQSNQSDSTSGQDANKSDGQSNKTEGSTSDDDTPDYKTMYEDLLFKTVIDSALQGLEFTSSFARDGITRLIKDKNLKIVNGKLEGVSEVLEQLKNEYPDAFKKSSNKPIFGKTRKNDSSGGSSVATFLSERYKNNPYYKG